MRDRRDPDRLYGAYYYERCLGEPCRRDNPTWARFFGRIADVLVAELRPATVLDLGCGFGFLVEALRDRGVQAWGIDISEVRGLAGARGRPAVLHRRLGHRPARA